MDITSNLPSCREDLILLNSTERFEYSIKLTLKKIKEIQEHIKLNPERAVENLNGAVEGGAAVITIRIRASIVKTNTVASFAELLPPSKNLS